MIKKRTYYFLILVFSPLLAEAQGIKSIPLLWQEVPFESTLLMGNPRIQVDHGKVFKLQLSTIIEELKTVTYREGNMKGSVAELSFPYQDGSFHAFTAKRNQTMHPLLNEKFPEIVTLDAYATDGSGAYGKWDITPAGLHAMIFIPGESTLFIDPLFEGNNEYYVVYRKKDFKTTKTIDCGVVNADESKPGNPVKTMFGTCELRTYRLALSATAEYTTFHGGTVNQAAAAQVVTMNRVNGVYEKDIAITMVIIPNNNSLIYTNASTDPYANGTPGTMINQNQTNTDNVIGSANYDIGHVFGTNSGGLAGLGVVCAGGQKARGVTGSAAPIGDPFDIDYVAHEMGHQFGGNHTQNNNCNSVAAARREPGSASTIMGYAGICAPNVQNNSDDYFHGYNLGEISAEILSNGHQCEVITPLNNTAPTIISTSGNIVVPISTPFILTGHATDPDGDVLTYLWEQMDNEASTQPPVATATGGPNFRSFDPTTDSSRYFPRLSALASNGPFTWEVLPSVARVMDFRLSVRDNHAVGSCNDFTDVTVTTNASAGPFVVTYPSAAGITWTGGSSQTVTWSVANTDAAPINCANVRILLSLNGGQSYPYVLSSSTANDGSETILCPNVTTNTARVMVLSSAGTFFDISNNNFTITCSGQDVPTFSGLSSVCQNDSSFTLPTTSTNGIDGTWNPAFNLANVGTSTYNFVPVATACATTTPVQVTVQPFETPTFDAWNPVCQFASITLPITSVNGVSGTWSPQVSSQLPGVTSYTFSPAVGVCAASISQTLQVLPAPLNTVSVNGITLSSQQNGATYQWIDCATNLPVPGAINQSFTTSEPTGNFAVIVTLEGCQDTSDCFFVDQSGLDEATLDFSVQPNPSTQDFQVTWTGQVLTLKLFDAAGKTVWEKSTQGVSEAIIPSHHIAAGVYYLNASHSQGEYTSKIMKY
ncbi:MAG: reprolysin-like metallopeptidase [Flavobacteriales bacterium]|jgi:hypothetical protein